MSVLLRGNRSSRALRARSVVSCAANATPVPQDIPTKKWHLQHKPLIDRFQRKHTYLRVSLTDRCNLRCEYCMPEETFEGTDCPSTQKNLLTAAEIQHIVGFLVELGVRKVRLTGGEPTIRKDFGKIIEGLGQIARPNNVSMGITTNGIRLKKFLPQLDDAGVRNVNLSLDSLVPAKFGLITRRPGKWLHRVMDALDACADNERFTLKVNTVALKGFNHDEIADFVALTEKRNIEVRFLEFMPFNGNSWSADRLVPKDRILELVRASVEDRGVELRKLPPDSLHDTAQLWKADSWKGRIGIISAMTDAFCGGCNRIRMTADGELRNCLFGEEGWSIRDALRGGADNAELAAIVSEAIWAKHARLGGKRNMYELKESDTLNRPMMTLGG